MPLMKVRIGDIFPSNPPRKTSWERVKNASKGLETDITLLATYGRMGLPGLVPKEGNHRIARLIELWGTDHTIEVEVIDAKPEDDLFNYQEGWRRCVTEGIINYSEFLIAATEGRWERTI